MAIAEEGPQQAEEEILSTLNRDGTRRWMRPKVSPGRFLNARRVVGYFLILLFSALPYIHINGKPTILLNIPAREFTLFGRTFLPTDTLLLALLFLMIFITIFFFTAIFGRVWCGWACPQTVYMELLYRPIERLFEGKNYRTGGKAQISPLRRIAKYFVYLLISMFLAHTFIAYFVGVDELFKWVQQSPFHHPKAFFVMAVVTGLMMFDFCYFREQVCTLMCPYGRFQSVMLDRHSLIISYDEKRGEPRKSHKKAAKAEAAAAGGTGDCIDCKLCITTCPTGIDIRKGLQLECIACAQCIDACDAVMDKIGKPRGLIRYSSQEAMATGRNRFLRPRLVLYPAVLAIVFTLFVVTLLGKGSAEVTFLRNRSTPYHILDNGDVTSTLLVKIINRSEDQREYDIKIPEAEKMDTNDLPLPVPPESGETATLHLTLPREKFTDGRARVTVHVSDGVDFNRTYSYYILGPLFGSNVATTTPNDPTNPTAPPSEN
ncbi:MAG TPA: cytochrome c oxidase accessory protein CcoG [Phycisphaeraceae bacterium]|nr:cytochrome c oxidase accessory protein CcoG [Phycisphaeraceae bacterium]